MEVLSHSEIRETLVYLRNKCYILPVSCQVLHNDPFLILLLSGIDQYDRDSIINDFKTGVCRLMVATSVAARGLDVKQLILVVNYNCPNHYEDYVHRAGRTGRAGNKVRQLSDKQMRWFQSVEGPSQCNRGQRNPKTHYITA